MAVTPARPQVGATTVEWCRSLVDALRMDGAAVTVRAGVDHGHLVLATDDTARAVDEWHLTLNEGPAIDAFVVRTAVEVPDLADRTAVARWPVLTREVGQLGVAALFAFPLQIGAVPFGTVALYRRTPGALAPASATGVAPATEGLAGAVLRELDPTSGPAVDHDEVTIATGMIAVHAAVTVTQALALLRAAAFAEHTSIHRVARAVVTRQRRFD